MITKAQAAKLLATGKVAEVEDEGMDEGRFFVHLKHPHHWALHGPNDIQYTKSFGSYREAEAGLKLSKTFNTRREIVKAEQALRDGAKAALGVSPDR